MASPTFHPIWATVFRALSKPPLDHSPAEVYVFPDWDLNVRVHYGTRYITLTWQKNCLPKLESSSYTDTS